MYKRAYDCKINTFVCLSRMEIEIEFNLSLVLICLIQPTVYEICNCKPGFIVLLYMC